MGLFSGLSNVLGTSNRFTAQAPANDFRATNTPLDESSYADAITRARDAAAGAAGGGNVGAQQTSLAQALQAQMAGNGPSLAQRQLESGTQQIQSQAAGQVASLNGINPALAARMIGQNTANAGQQAAGQAATTRLQEQLGTQGLLAQALQAQRAQDIGQQQANTALLGTAGGLQQGQNQTRVQQNLGVQGLNAGITEGNANRNLGAQQINAGVAAQNANTNAGLVGGLMQSGGAIASLFSDERLKRNVERHSDEVIDGVPRATFEYRAAPGIEMEGVIAQDVEREHPELVGRTADGIRYVHPALAAHPAEDEFSRALMAQRVKGYADGGAIYIPQIGVPDYSGAQYSRAGDALKDALGGLKKKSPPPAGTPPLTASPLAANVPAGNPFGVENSPLQSSVPTETLPWVPPDFSMIPAAAHGGEIDFRDGGPVPGRARVAGDDPRNDTVPARVSPGEIVLPRSVAQAEDAPDQAAAFVDAIRKKKAPETGYGKVLAGQRALEERLAQIEIERRLAPAAQR